MTLILKKTKKCFRQLSRNTRGQGYLIKGLFGNGIIRVSITLTMFLISVGLARNLGPSQYGLYTLGLSLATVLMSPLQIGLSTFLVREVARYHLTLRFDLIRGLTNRYFQLMAAGGAAIVALGGTCIFLSSGGVYFQTTIIVTFGLFLSLAISILSGFGAILQGFRKVTLGQLPDLILRLGFLIMLSLSALVGWHLSASGAMLIHIFSAALACGTTYIIFHATILEKICGFEPAYDDRNWLQLLRPMLVMSGLFVANSQVDIVMIGAFLNTKDLGIYRVAFQTSTLVAFSLIIINSVISPQLSRLYAANEMKKLQALVSLSTKIIVSVSAPIGLALLVFSSQTIEFIFGSHYASAAVALDILLVGQFANAAMGPAATILNMTGHERDTTKGVLLAISTNILLNTVLLPIVGINGAAVSTSSSLIVWNVYLSRKAFIRTGINSSILRASLMLST